MPPSAVFRRLISARGLAGKATGLVALLALALRLEAGPEAAPPAKSEIVVSIVGGSRNAGFDHGMKALIEAYRGFHPEVAVIVENKGNGYGVGYPTWLNTQLASGAPRPDIVSGNYCKDYAHYVNLDYYGGQINPYTGRPMNEGLDFDFFKSTNSRGERTMLSTQMVKVMWYYNRDVFAQLKLRPPETWDEFLATCEKLRAAGKVPTSLRFNYRFYQWLFEIVLDQYTRANIELVRARPGDWCFDPGRDGTWTYNPADPLNDAAPTLNYARLLGAIRRREIRYDDAAFVQVLETLKSLAPYVPADFLVDTPTADAEAYTLFLNGTAAMHLDTSFLLTELDRDVAGAAGFKWGIFDTPSQVNRWVQAPARSVESAAGEYVSIISKNQPQNDRVLDFLHFWFSARVYQTFVDGQIASGNFQPTGVIMVHGVKLPPSYRERFDAVVRRGNAEIPMNYISGLLPPGSRLLNDFKQTLTELMQGKIDAPVASRRIQAMMLEAVSEILVRNRLDDSFLEHPERDPNG
jgi:ABC-type glycerol-3-phosphate transport system substrate-binding protein